MSALPGLSRHPLPVVLVLALLAALAVACGNSGGTDSPSTATPTPAPARVEERTPTAEATLSPTPPAEPSPEPTAEPTPEPTPPPPPPPRVIGPVDGYVVAAAVAYAAPYSSANVARNLPAGTRVTVMQSEDGENWIIGDQDWVPVYQPWTDDWYRLDDGAYVHSAFVYLGAPPGGAAVSSGAPERYVIVDLSMQTAFAMEGSNVVRSMPVTTGKEGFETPVGEFRVLENGRIWNERMTSQRAGIDAPGEQYDVERVLYTQYFLTGGFALHLNYWQPSGVYGGYPTSHGCVGFQLEDAQFLWLFGFPGMRVIVRESGGAAPAPPPPPPPSPPPPPKPEPEPASEVVQIYAVRGAAPAGSATVAARTTPGLGCLAEYTDAAGTRRSRPELASKVADAGGWLEWTWTIDAGEPPGTATIVVACPGGSARAPVPVG